MGSAFETIARDDLFFTLDRLRLSAHLASTGWIEDETSVLGDFFALCEWALRRREPVVALEAALRFRNWKRLPSAGDIGRAAERLRDLRRGFGAKFMQRSEVLERYES